ncbi:cyclic nucleotide-binding protein [Clostridia bacterium]|nr:cyclic nucleotide-binding protein [Clostridia bacterium]
MQKIEINESIRNCQLFLNVCDEDLEKMLRCLAATAEKYEKNSYVYHAGENVRKVGIVLSGGVHIIDDDYWGNRTIISTIMPGSTFGESFSFAGERRLLTSAIAYEKTEVMYIDCRRIITPCDNLCSFHLGLVANLMELLAKTNVRLVRKIRLITGRNIREKVMLYLSEQSQLTGETTFRIPYNRQELADFLSVDRSALSAELSKMQKDGIIKYKKSNFKLL